MKPELKNLFSSPLWIYNLAEENPHLAHMVKLDGTNFSNAVNAGQCGPNDFFKFNGYGIEQLRDYVDTAIKDIAQKRSWPEHDIDMRVRHNVIKPLECDTPHHHPDLDLVGVYYVSVPSNSGNILFYDPRGSVKILWEDPAVGPDSQGRTGRVCYSLTPTVGTLVLFPSYLFHSVETNLSEENRISIVMDIRINPKEVNGTY
jgi:uncharacterized protein (TIGR02466 family)